SAPNASAAASPFGSESGCPDSVRTSTHRTCGSRAMRRSPGKDEVWKHLVQKLGQQFFVVNNLDKDSGERKPSQVLLTRALYWSG
ncbi:MAG TPA: hypothetical protein VMT52_16075, partial [Planctomycetota bacterium]|nr:hypothetical protein [Planctomycetota bacterium]